MSKEQELQVLAEDMASIAVDGHGYQWVFDKIKEEQFIKFISRYVMRAAAKSEKSFYYQYGREDPEDAYGDVISSIWVAFRKYGPRPMGNDFSYLLKLKTNNTLTNRVRKMKSDKSKLNFISCSLDSLHHSEDSDAEDKYSAHVLDPTFVSYVKKSPTRVYNKFAKEKNMEFIDAKDAVLGDVYLTRNDKLVQVSEIRGDVVILKVFATDKSLPVPLTYPLRAYAGSEEDPVEAEITEEIKQVVEEEPVLSVAPVSDSPEVQEEEPIVFSASEMLADAEDICEEPPVIGQTESEPETEKENVVEGKSLKAQCLEVLHAAGSLTRQELVDKIALERGLPPEKRAALLTQVSVQLTLLKKAGRIINEKMKWRVVTA